MGHGANVTESKRARSSRRWLPWVAAGAVLVVELTLTKKPGDTVPIGYTRAGHSATTTVTLGAQP